MSSIEDKEFLKAFGEKVRFYRKEKKLSMQQLANLAEIELSQIFRIETGKINPKITTVSNIAKALELPLDILLK